MKEFVDSISQAVRLYGHQKIENYVNQHHEEIQKDGRTYYKIYETSGDSPKEIFACLNKEEMDIHQVNKVNAQFGLLLSKIVQKNDVPAPIEKEKKNWFHLPKIEFRLPNPSRGNPSSFFSSPSRPIPQLPPATIPVLPHQEVKKTESPTQEEKVLETVKEIEPYLNQAFGKITAFQAISFLFEHFSQKAEVGDYLVISDQPMSYVLYHATTQGGHAKTLNFKIEQDGTIITDKKIYANFEEMKRELNLLNKISDNEVCQEVREPVVENLPDGLELINPLEGQRSMQMKGLLSAFSNFNSTKGVLEVNNTEYYPLKGTILDVSQRAIASCGSNNTREVILLDPNNSPLLNKHYEILKAKLLKKSDTFRNEEEILYAVKKYVREHIFSTCLLGIDLDPMTLAFVKEKKNTNPCETFAGEKIPFIPIDEFMSEGGFGLGICRHHSLVTTYILDRLIREPNQPFLQGVVQHLRDNVPGGAHTWLAFQSASGARWHIDTYWNVLERYDNDNIQHLAKRYGENAMKNQLKRTEVAKKRSG